MELTAQNTAVVLDSTADFPEAPQRFPNWRVVPLYVLFGDESYRDYVELSPHEFYVRLRDAQQLPTTSQPTPGDFLRRGGRIGRASAWAGELLHVKPILTIEREVVPLKRVRGNRKAMQEFVNEFTATTHDTPTLRV